ncbi:hypothetical protein D3C87_1093750 [compost metagenome]
MHISTGTERIGLVHEFLKPVSRSTTAQVLVVKSAFGIIDIYFFIIEEIAMTKYTGFIPWIAV